MLELLDASKIRVSDATRAILDDVSETARQINDLRPLTDDVVKGILNQMRGERVYSSNAIEGSSLTLRETTAILKTGYTAGFKKRQEATEVMNLGRAIDHAQNLDKGALAQVSVFTTTHGILLKGLREDAGMFRREQVMLTGAMHQPPDATEVPGLVERALAGLAAQLDSSAEIQHGALLAAWVHWAIARIHPFMDGNGRIARLWQDMTLFKRGLTCAVIRPEDRRDYYAALEAADSGEFDNLIQLVSQRVLATFDKYRLAKQSADEVVSWAASIAGEADTRLEEKRKLEYLRWQRKMEELLFEFERCAVAITHASAEIEVQVRKLGLIDRDAWEELRSGSPVSRTGFFWLKARRERKPIRYNFFFGKHYWNDSDDAQERSEPRVALLISEQLGDEEKATYEQNDGVLPDEFFLVGDHFVRRRFDPAAKKTVNDRGLEPIRVAQDFLRDVVLRRLTP